MDFNNPFNNFKMKVSIIISVVEDRGYLEKAIKSALNQDYDDYEIVLASDGNPAMKSYADKWNLKFSLQEIKSNISTNFNKAALIAKGEFLKALSDDDLLTTNCLKDLVNNIGNKSLIFANSIDFWQNGTNIINKPSIKKGDFNELIRLKSSYIHGGTIMFRKDIFLNRGGFDERLECCEEYDYYLYLLSKGYEFAYLDKIVYEYRKHNKQKSLVHSPKERERRMRYKNYIINKYL